MKRLKASLESQLEAQSKRSMRPHEFGCDIEKCVKKVCFERVPDKIVGEPYKVKR